MPALAYFRETLSATPMTRRSSSIAKFAGATFRTTDADHFTERGNRDALLGTARFRPNHHAQSRGWRSLGEKLTSPREPLNSSCGNPQKSFQHKLRRHQSSNFTRRIPPARPLHPAHQHENNNDDEHESEAARRVVTPLTAIGLSRERANEKQN
jgi:hypothetical protein